MMGADRCWELSVVHVGVGNVQPRGPSGKTAARPTHPPRLSGRPRARRRDGAVGSSRAASRAADT
jgi:hypothetical protein